MKVYLDGRFVDEGEATISIFDAAVQHGVGLFETMRAYRGRVFRLGGHVDRLIASARELGLTERLRRDPLCEAVEAALGKSKLGDARIRLTLTGGNLSLLTAARGDGRKPPEHRPSIAVQVAEPTVYPESLLERGAAVIVADPKANPFDPMAGHKTVNYWLRLRTLAAAAAAKAAEALWLTVTNHLCGGAVSNAVLVKEEQLLTPIARGEEPGGAIASPVLPGITRAALIEAAGALGLPVHRRMLTIHDVLEADELMLTNTSWLVLPVVRVEGKTIGQGQVGPITRRLYERLLRLIGEECGAGGDSGGENG